MKKLKNIFFYFYQYFENPYLEKTGTKNAKFDGVLTTLTTAQPIAI